MKASVILPPEASLFPAGYERGDSSGWMGAYSSVSFFKGSPFPGGLAKFLGEGFVLSFLRYK